MSCDMWNVNSFMYIKAFHCFYIFELGCWVTWSSFVKSTLIITDDNNNDISSLAEFPHEQLHVLLKWPSVLWAAHWPPVWPLWSPCPAWRGSPAPASSDSCSHRWASWGPAAGSAGSYALLNTTTHTVNTRVLTHTITRRRNRKRHLTRQVLVDRLHLALSSDERLLDHAVLLLLQVLHLGLQLTLSSLHLSLIDQDLEEEEDKMRGDTQTDTKSDSSWETITSVCCSPADEENVMTTVTSHHTHTYTHTHTHTHSAPVQYSSDVFIYKYVLVFSPSDISQHSTWN